MKPRLIVLHSSDAPSHFGLEAITRWHTDQPPHGNGWPLVGYCAVVSTDAVDAWRVEHAGDPSPKRYQVAGINSSSMGICIAGRYDEAPPPLEAMELAAQVCAVWCQQYDLSSDDVIGHREAPGHGASPTTKTCPGAAVDLPAFREMVRERLDVLRALS